jgi:hypothetical protein
MSTIFIAVPSLKDPEIFKTVSSIYKNAKKPENVYVGLFYQYITDQEKSFVEEEMSQYSNLRLKAEFVKNSIGLSKGRNTAMSLYDGETYILQIDSHTKFDKGWDLNLINIFNDALGYLKSDKVILTAYLNEYSYKKTIFGIKAYHPKGTTAPSYTYMNNSKMILDYLPAWRNNYNKLEKDFLPSRKFAANFVFTYGKYKDDLLLNDQVLFWSEEYTKSIDLLSKGYALVHPNKKIRMTHLYGNNFNHYMGKRRFSLEDYLGTQEKRDELSEKEREFVVDYIESHPDKEKYEAYAGIRFGKQMCKTIWYTPPVFFLKDIV